MIYSVNFMDMTEKINPLAFSRYLKDTGWRLFPTKKDYIKIFQYEINEEFYQVVVPTDKKLSDYKQAMYAAVNTVSQVEKKSLEQVMLYLLNPNTDILKIRLDKQDTEAGNILFDDAIRLFENAKKLLAATALDIINPKTYHHGRVDDSVQKFLSDCRFGQTEIGSYVVSVVCPFAELDEGEGYKQLSIFTDEEQCAKSLTRQITSRVMKNISTIKKHIDEGEIQALIEHQDGDVISANFYEALIGLNLNADNTKVEFIAEWSPVVKNRDCNYNNITLSNDYYQPIETTIQKLKEEKNKSSRILGRIKKLESSPVVEKRTMGKVSIAYLDDDNKSRVVSTKLDKNDYDKAIEAHAQGKHVEVIGELTTGNKATIKCESFSIID